MPSNPNPTLCSELGSSRFVGYTAYALVTFLPLCESENAELALDIEFESEWGGTSDGNEEDVEGVVEGKESCCTHLRGQGEGEEEVKVRGMGEGGGVWRRICRRRVMLYS